ncbi:collagen-like protein [Lacticaseibacillus rhamnosus]|uniref:collagen-like triple helix repeat-containing protein n=1 Tax=Lacticaseibacillus rhamnosus TaxID=47715 RepID=UPI0022E8DBF1|nr:collagen-like protein [Lacticaseibacillus rhamnosus]
MQWFILSRDQHVLCAPSTDARNSLPIYDDTEDIVLSNNTAITSYEFTVDNTHPDAKKLAVGGYIAYTNKYHQVKLCTLIDHDGDDFTQTWHAEDIGMDLINEQADKVTYTEPHGFAYYANELLADTGWTLGINEISTLSRTLSFDGQEDTKLKRIGDIANEFDGAELEFVVKMDGSTITEQVVNVWKKIGNGKTQQRFVDAVNLSALKTSGTIDSLHTAMAGYGSTPTSTTDTGQEQEPITFADIAYDDGRFFSPRGDKVVYDRVAGKTWARLGAFDPQNRSATKGYLVGNYSYDTSNPNELLNRTITQLKSVNTPKESYEADVVDIKADIGDYVQIAHHNYHPPVYLSARVLEVKNHYTVPNSDTAVFGNYSLLESDLDPRIVAMINGLAKQTEKYPWVRYADDDKGTNMSALPAGKKYMAIVWSNKTSVPSDNPDDYAGHWALIQGKDGADGVPGAKGADGRTSYFHTAWADDVSGQSGFTVSGGDGKKYIGTYSDFTQADSNNPSDYNWALFKGDKGDQGPKGDKGDQGPKGDKGDQGPQGVPGSKDVPYTYIQLGTPTSPKKGDLWWHGTTLNDATALQYYNGSTWIDQSIQQAVLSIKKLQSIEIDSAEINSPTINVPFAHAPIEGGNILSTGKLALNGTSYTIDGTIEDTKGNPNGQRYHTELNPDGLLSYITQTDGTTKMDVSRISMGTLEFTHLASGLGNSATYISSTLDTVKVLQLANNNQMVWQGAMMPENGDVATMSVPLSQTLTGWLIAWSYFQNGVPTHNNYAFTLIPKAALVYNTTGANYLRVTLTMNEVGTTYKLLFYDDRHIVGNDENARGYPAKAVMTEVYAV